MIFESRLKRARKDLLAAADAIEKYGWVRGSMGRRDYGFCAIGAIREAVGLNALRRRERAMHILAEYLEARNSRLGVETSLSQRGHDRAVITTWNDVYVSGLYAISTSEVIDTIRAAARED